MKYCRWQNRNLISVSGEQGIAAAAQINAIKPSISSIHKLEGGIKDRIIDRKKKLSLMIHVVT